MRLPLAVFLTMVTSCSVFSQNYTINTVAGGGFPENIPARSASLDGISGIVTDATGTVFIPLQQRHIVLRLDSNGVLTRVAGNGIKGYLGDGGPATSAQLWNPPGIALDAAGNLYIADEGNGRIRKVSNGVITTVAGGGSANGDRSPPLS